jgi:hypothetical protein
MKATAIRKLVSEMKPPMTFYTSDGRLVYVDHPEAVLVHEQVVAIGSGVNGGNRVVKDIIFLSPDHIVRIEPAKRRPLRPLKRAARNP